MNKEYIMTNKNYKRNDMTLDLLSAVEADSSITQRSLSRELGIALGLTNSYLKKCIDKGLVKIKQVPANRYTYYLTPRGFSEKSRLTAEYFRSSFSFYRKAKNDFTKIMENCVKNKKFNILLSDISELAEIAIIISFSTDINIIGILGHSDKKNINGIPINEDIKFFKNFDKIIITDISDTKARYDYLSKFISTKKIIIPNSLKLKKLKED